MAVVTELWPESRAKVDLHANEPLTTLAQFRANVGRATEKAAKVQCFLDGGGRHRRGQGHKQRCSEARERQLTGVKNQQDGTLARDRAKVPESAGSGRGDRGVMWLLQWQYKIPKGKVNDMDDKALEVSRKKLAALDKQLADLAVKQRATESRLDGEHQIIRKAAAERMGVVAQLVDADSPTAAKLHKQLDGLDQQIKSSERLAESYQHALKDIASQTATVTVEHDRVNQIVGAENNARAFALWTANMVEQFKTVHEAMATARLTLGRLCIEAAHGCEQFRGAAANWAANEFDQFERLEANPDTLLSFKMATPWYRNVRITINPMEKR